MDIPIRGNLSPTTLRRAGLINARRLGIDGLPGRRVRRRELLQSFTAVPPIHPCYRGQGCPRRPPRCPDQRPVANLAHALKSRMRVLTGSRAAPWTRRRLPGRPAGRSGRVAAVQWLWLVFPPGS
jgi:hypothetical protein